MPRSRRLYPCTTRRSFSSPRCCCMCRSGRNNGACRICIPHQKSPAHWRGVRKTVKQVKRRDRSFRGHAFYIMGIAAFAVQRVQPLARNAVTQTARTFRCPGCLVSQSAHTGLAPYRSAPLVSVRQTGSCLSPMEWNNNIKQKCKNYTNCSH